MRRHEGNQCTRQREGHETFIVTSSFARGRPPRDTAFVQTLSLLGALTAGTLLTLVASVPLARGDAKPTTISVAEIKEGMKGYGLTVFKGTRPERFDVEVIGVLHAFRPGQPLIVIRTPHPRLDIVKTVHGMSGSPIYLDGRLAGAYSYALSQFPIEPIAGVTPIDLMMTEMRRPIPPGFWPLDRNAPLPGAHPTTPPPAHASNERFEGLPGTYDLWAHARQLADRGQDPASPIRPATTPLMMAGVTDHVAASLRKLLEPLGLEPVQGGGGDANDPTAPEHFVDGAGLGVQLVRGDLSMMGLGTATFADGTGKVAGFGHPMFNAGASAMPTCIGRVLFINGSTMASSKVGECARAMGTLVQDRQSAIVLDETVKAPVIPVDIEIVGATGAPKPHWHAEIAEDKFMAPGLAAAVLGSVIEATTSERRDLTWKFDATVTVAGHGAVHLEDIGVAVGGVPETPEWFRSKLVNTVGDVLNNPWELARVSKIEAKFEVHYERDLWRLRGVEVLDPAVDAGENARLRLHLVPEEGAETTRVVEVAMPSELAGKDVEIEVVPGYEVVPELAPPETLDELLANEPRQSVAPRSGRVA